MVSRSTRPPRDPNKYRGRNLLWLLGLLGVPAPVLYLAIAFAVVASESPMSQSRSAALLVASNNAFFAFAAVQLAAAWFIFKRFARPLPTKASNALAFMGLIIFCTCCSVVSAVMLEAFGFAILARLVQHVR